MGSPKKATAGDRLKLVTMCRVMAKFFGRIFRNVSDFVICDHAMGRVFCVRFTA